MVGRAEWLLDKELDDERGKFQCEREDEMERMSKKQFDTAAHWIGGGPFSGQTVAVCEYGRLMVAEAVRARASETRLEKEPKEALRCPSCETCDCGEFRDAFDALTREKREAEEARDEAERLLRLACERLTGTPLAEQSSFIHDISLAIDAAVQDFDATKEGDRG